jgi:putative Mg2+ transporter-C (MgtC) family protein
VEGAFIGCILISVTIIVFSRLERIILSRSRNLNLNVEFEHVDDVGKIISAIKAQNIRIFDVEIHKSKSTEKCPSAVFSVRLPKRMLHTELLTLLAGVENVRSIEEL